jgi:hypothetical protein
MNHQCGGCLPGYRSTHEQSSCMTPIPPKVPGSDHGISSDCGQLHWTENGGRRPWDAETKGRQARAGNVSRQPGVPPARAGDQIGGCGRARCYMQRILKNLDAVDGGAGPTYLVAQRRFDREFKRNTLKSAPSKPIRIHQKARDASFGPPSWAASERRSGARGW